MEKKVRLGFIGSGFMGQKAHLDNFVTIQDCEIVALAEGREKTAQMVAQQYNIPKVYPHHRAMLEEEELDAVVAILPYSLHKSVVPDVLKAGKHLLTEKPICVQVETARALVELAETKGVIYQVGYMKRFTPAATVAQSTVRNWKQSGEAGNWTYLRAAMPPGDWTFRIDPPVIADEPWPSYEEEEPEGFPPTLSEEIAEIYNAFVNYYIHQVNLIRFLLGEDYRATYADPGGAVLVGESDSGVTLVLEMKGYGLKNDWEETYRMVFDKGKIDLSIPAPMARQRPGSVEIYKAFDDGATPLFERPSLPADWCFKMQAQGFIQSIKEGTPSVSPASHALRDLEVAMQYAQLLGESRS